MEYVDQFSEHSDERLIKPSSLFVDQETYMALIISFSNIAQILFVCPAGNTTEKYTSTKIYLYGNLA